MSQRIAKLWPGIIAAMICALTATADEAFRDGTNAYYAGQFGQSAEAFRRSAAASPAAGTLHNLGNAEWQGNHRGAAILAWEQAQWLNPYDRNTSANLRFARKVAQLDPPELSWFESCSAWLPVDWWAVIACVSFWTALGLVALPGMLGWRKAGWHQAVAAAGLAVFLLCLPALAGVFSRSKIGIILPKDAPLRLTPTSEGQILARLPAGDAGRCERERGNFVFVRTAVAAGWMEKRQFGIISGDPR